MSYEIGDLVLALDSQVLHGRTCFSDYYKSKSVLANNATKLPLKKLWFERGSKHKELKCNTFNCWFW